MITCRSTIEVDRFEKYGILPGQKRKANDEGKEQEKSLREKQAKVSMLTMRKYKNINFFIYFSQRSFIYFLNKSYTKCLLIRKMKY